jgi:hypothetical protein
MFSKALNGYFDRLFRTKAGRHLLLLKVIVATGLILNHYYPGHMGLFTNLIWLFAF